MVKAAHGSTYIHMYIVTMVKPHNDPPHFNHGYITCEGEMKGLYLNQGMVKESIVTMVKSG